MVTKQVVKDPPRLTLAQEAQYRQWASNPTGFASAVKILNKQGKRQTFDIRDYQEQVIATYNDSTTTVALKARQIGLTTTACFLALWTALFTPDRFIIVMSKTDGDSVKFLRRVKQMYDWLPLWVKGRAPAIKGVWGKHSVEFVNNSVIFSATSGTEHGRGDSPTDVFVDEIGFCRDPEGLWKAIIPAVEEGGRVLAFGTADGAGTWFHEKWKEWDGDDHVSTMFFPWTVIPGRDEAWKDRQVRLLGPSGFKQEYPETPEEAFQQAGASVFDFEALEAVQPAELVQSQIGYNEAGYPVLRTLGGVPSESGLFVFEGPVDGARYVVAGDPAEGLDGSDTSVAQVLRLDKDRIVQVAVQRGRDEPGYFARLCADLSRLYRECPIVIERNNHGGTVIRELRKKTPAVNLFWEKKGKPGFWTHPGVKAEGIIELQRLLVDGEIVVNDEVTLRELWGFREKRTASGNVRWDGVGHDDHVDALCLGVRYSLIDPRRSVDVETPAPRVYDPEKKQGFVVTLNLLQSPKFGGIV